MKSTLGTLSAVFFIALITCGIFLLGNVRAATAQQGTTVSGVLSANTTWTKADSPYNVTGNVTIPQGISLTIDPGAFVFLNEYFIQVDGILSAVGSSSNMISFTVLRPFPATYPMGYSGGGFSFTPSSTNWDGQTGKGCIIENANFTGGVRIDVRASPKIDQNFAHYWNMYIYDGSPTISSNTLMGCRLEVGGGAPQIFNNTITSGYGFLADYGVIFWGANQAVVSNNYINGFFDGAAVTVDAGTPTIVGNLISSDPVRNGFNNGFGVQLIGVSNPIIENNTIAGNVMGICVQESSGFPSPTIRNNNILDNSEYNVYIVPGSIIHNQILDSSAGETLNASYNWWGTTDAQAINQTIYDSKNSSLAGTVNFVPFLTSTNIAAPPAPTPSASPSPTPTATVPELPAWTIPLLATVIALISVTATRQESLERRKHTQAVHCANGS